MTPISTFMDGTPPIRGVLWLGLSDTARVLVRGTASDGGGGYTETYTPAPTLAWGSSTNFACRIDALTGTEGQTANRISDRSTHLVTLNTGGTISISLSDDLQIQNRGRYEITAIREHTGEFVRELEVTDRTS